MTRDDIIRMAKEYANEVTNGYGVVFYEFDLYGLEKFALLIRAAEREWQGLTNEEIEQIEISASSKLSAIYLAEAQLKGKNYDKS